MCAAWVLSSNEDMGMCVGCVLSSNGNPNVCCMMLRSNGNMAMCCVGAEQQLRHGRVLPKPKKPTTTQAPKPPSFYRQMPGL